MADIDKIALRGLQSKQHLELLDVIDSLRAQGLNEHVALPQLIVSGDQSSGKSSVLDAISGVPFPKKDNLCTRFATEVILRRNDDAKEIQATVSLMPGSSRTPAERASLKKFHRDLHSIDELPQVVAEATMAMGLGTVGSSAFSTDILRLEITGPRMPQLTIVDLPGLIHSENKFQSAEDVKMVTKLVEEYMAQERSIILAIVSAKNDYANQIVLTKARQVDPDGRRTLGIITKPDTAFGGSSSEGSFINLAKNQDVKFSLGWHVVRNLDSNDVSGIDRDVQEEDFFETSRWRCLPSDTRGIHSLRERLSEVLFQQIRTELPSLLSEVSQALEGTQQELTRIGRSRTSDLDRRIFIMELGQEYSKLCHAACEGLYDDTFFAEQVNKDTSTRRLRAVVQNCNIEFSKQMLRSLSNNHTSSAQALERAKSLIWTHRGKELPGTFNPSLIGQLFRERAVSWLEQTQQHAHDIWRRARSTIVDILNEVCEEHVRDTCLSMLIDPQLKTMRTSLDERLENYMAAFKRHPITYNHYLTEKVQAMALQRRRVVTYEAVQSLFEDRTRLGADDVGLIVDCIANTTESDMDRLAAQTLADYAQAYLTVALKRVIDEVPAHVIEPTVMTSIPNLLDSSKVLTMSADTIAAIGGESAARMERRKQLEVKVKVLQGSRIICELYSSRQLDVPVTLAQAQRISDELGELVQTPDETVSSGGSFDRVEEEPTADEEAPADVPLDYEVEISVEKTDPVPEPADDEWGMFASRPKKSKKKSKMQWGLDG